MTRKHVCLITPGHIASCPRLAKEADALVEAGYEVTVVSGRHFAPADSLDTAVTAAARWRCLRVPTQEGVGVACRRGVGRLLRKVRGDNVCSGIGEATLVVFPALPRLVRAAAGVQADFYHAHCLPGLAIAALAARETGKRYGFDAEDFHERETLAVENSVFERSVATIILRAFLPRATIRTAASPLIAAAYEQAYGCSMTVILNSFDPVRKGHTRNAFRELTSADPAKLYWFSQTIGPGRGLEQMIDVLAVAKTPLCLQLRGFSSEEYRVTLLQRAQRAGVRLEFLAPANPDEMVALAAEADVGLSLEQRVPGNRNLCLTNKVFAYLAAGIPQLMSQTTAQEAFAGEIGDAGLLIDLEDAAGSARRIDGLLGDKERMDMGCRAARDAQVRFGWPSEKAKLVALFKATV
jgi:glycosyltransferase involved in cell wall biosynthesis